MRKFALLFTSFVTYFFILLFVYASVSKLMDFENFQVQIAQSPVMSPYAGLASYAVIIIELFFAGLLVSEATRLLGLYCSLGLMTSFSVYIYVTLNYSESVPCSCGGILEKLGWREHLIFNIVCVIILTISIIIFEKFKDKRSVQYVCKIIMTVLVSGLFVVFTYRSSVYVIKKENNFTRKFIPHAIDYPKMTDLKNNSFYFAGSLNDTLYLGNTTAPLIMGKLAPEFDHLILDTLDIDNKNLAFSSIRLQVEYPNYMISDGRVPVIFEGIFPQNSATSKMTEKLFFSQLLWIGPSHYIFRTHHKLKNENTVGSVMLNNKNDKIKFNHQFLEKQIDGLFDTDGILVKDGKTQEFIYTYFYRNEYRRINRDLKFLGNGRTIDSTSTAQIEVKKTKNGEIKMIRPPLKVNSLQYAYDGLLFNVSNLKGKHESDNIWKKSSIIDVYDYRKNDYLYSFPVQNVDGNKVRDILVTEQYFYVLISNDIMKYKRMYKPR